VVLSLPLVYLLCNHTPSKNSKGEHFSFESLLFATLFSLLNPLFQIIKVSCFYAFLSNFKAHFISLWPNSLCLWVAHQGNLFGELASHFLSWIWKFRTWAPLSWCFHSATPPTAFISWSYKRSHILSHLIAELPWTFSNLISYFA